MMRNNAAGNAENDIPPRRPWPSRLFVETTTRCNLNCRMCVKETWDRNPAVFRGCCRPGTPCQDVCLYH